MNKIFGKMNIAKCTRVKNENSRKKESEIMKLIIYAHQITDSLIHTRTNIYLHHDRKMLILLFILRFDEFYYENYIFITG